VGKRGHTDSQPLDDFDGGCSLYDVHLDAGGSEEQVHEERGLSRWGTVASLPRASCSTRA
jgi:hypothetical protein